MEEKTTEENLITPDPIPVAINTIDTTKLNKTDLVTITEVRSVGRPSDYTQETALKVCEELAQGKSMRTVCLMEGMPSVATLFKWMRDYPEFLKQYERAKEESADADLETIEDLGDIAIQEAKDADPKSANAIVNAYKIKADNLKWGMSKKKPKKFGDKIDMTTNGKDLPAPIMAIQNNVQANNSDSESVANE